MQSLKALLEDYQQHRLRVQRNRNHLLILKFQMLKSQHKIPVLQNQSLRAHRQISPVFINNHPKQTKLRLYLLVIRVNLDNNSPSLNLRQLFRPEINLSLIQELEMVNKHSKKAQINTNQLIKNIKQLHQHSPQISRQIRLVH